MEGNTIVEILEDTCSSVVQKKHEQMQLEIKSLQEKIFSLESANDESQAKVEFLKNKVLQLEKEAQIKSTKISMDLRDELEFSNKKAEEFETTLEIYKKKLIDQSDLKRHVKKQEEMISGYIQKNMQLEAEVGKTAQLMNQVGLSRKNDAQELSKRLFEETRKADHFEFECKSMGEILNAVQKENNRLIGDKRALKEKIEDLKCYIAQIQNEKIIKGNGQMRAEGSISDLDLIDPKIKEKIIRLEQENNSLKALLDEKKLAGGDSSNQMDSHSSPTSTSSTVGSGYLEELSVRDDLMGLAIGAHGANIQNARDLEGISGIDLDETTCSFYSCIPGESSISKDDDLFDDDVFDDDERLTDQNEKLRALLVDKESLVTELESRISELETVIGILNERIMEKENQAAISLGAAPSSSTGEQAAKRRKNTPGKNTPGKNTPRRRPVDIAKILVPLIREYKRILVIRATPGNNKSDVQYRVPPSYEEKLLSMPDVVRHLEEFAGKPLTTDLTEENFTFEKKKFTDHDNEEDVDDILPSGNSDQYEFQPTVHGSGYNF